MATLNSNSDSKPGIAPVLSKQLLQLVTPPDGSSNKKRIPQETARSVSQVLDMMVLEARSRASLEAECDAVDNENRENNFVEIRADHISKIAADLMIDFT